MSVLDRATNDALNAVIDLHRAVPDHGAFSGDPQRCQPEWCDHDAAEPLVCAECRTYTGDSIAFPCPTIAALTAAAETTLPR